MSKRNTTWTSIRRLLQPWRRSPYLSPNGSLERWLVMARSEMSTRVSTCNTVGRLPSSRFLSARSVIMKALSSAKYEPSSKRSHCLVVYSTKTLSNSLELTRAASIWMSSLNTLLVAPSKPTTKSLTSMRSACRRIRSRFCSALNTSTTTISYIVTLRQPTFWSGMMAHASSQISAPVRRSLRRHRQRRRVSVVRHTGWHLRWSSKPVIIGLQIFGAWVALSTRWSRSSRPGWTARGKFDCLKCCIRLQTPPSRLSTQVGFRRRWKTSSIAAFSRSREHVQTFMSFLGILSSRAMNLLHHWLTLIDCNQLTSRYRRSRMQVPSATAGSTLVAFSSTKWIRRRETSNLLKESQWCNIRHTCSTMMWVHTVASARRRMEETLRTTRISSSSSSKLIIATTRQWWLILTSARSLTFQNLRSFPAFSAPRSLPRSLNQNLIHGRVLPQVGSPITSRLGPRDSQAKRSVHSALRRPAMLTNPTSRTEVRTDRTAMKKNM